MNLIDYTSFIVDIRHVRHHWNAVYLPFQDFDALYVDCFVGACVGWVHFVQCLKFIVAKFAKKVEFHILCPVSHEQSIWLAKFHRKKTFWISNIGTILQIVDIASSLLTLAHAAGKQPNQRRYHWKDNKQAFTWYPTSWILYHIHELV